MSEHVFKIGDLVTAPRMRDWDGLLLCRIGQAYQGEFLLLPVGRGALPRGILGSDLTLVEAWTGPALRRWNENGTTILADDQPGSTAEAPAEPNNQPR